MIRDMPFRKWGMAFAAAAFGIALYATGAPVSAQTVLTPEMQQKLTLEALTAPPPRPHPAPSYRRTSTYSRAAVSRSGRGSRTSHSSRHVVSRRGNSHPQPARSLASHRPPAHRTMTSQR
jgi:hypothetical protein